MLRLFMKHQHTKLNKHAKRINIDLKFIKGATYENLIIFLLIYQNLP